jgi:hypothetical protein
MRASLKPRARLSPDEAVRIAIKAASSQPPKLATEDRTQSFNLRLRTSTIAAIAARARSDGATLKQIICRALANADVDLAPVDPEDGTLPREAAA